MSTNEKTKLTPLQVVERYYEKYIEYESAFNSEPFDNKQMEEQVKKIVESGADFESDEFNDVIVSLMIEKPNRRNDVEISAMKFVTYASFYELTQEEPLPEHIDKDYKELSKNKHKFHYSIENGKFVKNDDAPISLDKEKLKAIYLQIKKQLKE